MKKMAREPEISPKKGTFGTSISFDLDEKPAPQRRVGRKESTKEYSQVHHNLLLFGPNWSVLGITQEISG